MPLLGRILRRSVCCLLGLVSGVCAAQQSPQVKALPYVQLTGGRVTSLLAGTFQSPGHGVDVLYINAPTGSGINSSIIAGAMLDGSGFKIPDQNQIPFTNVSNVVAALGNFNGDGLTDFAFALSPAVASTGANYLCVYYGTGASAADTTNVSVSSYNGGNSYPPLLGVKSGCMTFTTQGGKPNFAYIAALPFVTGGLSQLLVEDSANNYLYVFSNSGTTGGSLSAAFMPIQSIPIPKADGPGPIYSGYFDENGNPFFIINGQTGHSVTVYKGDSSGNFAPIANYNVSNFGGYIYSMLMQDMDMPADGIADMVVEGKDGSIEIFPGDGNGGFSTTSEGGTSAIPSPLSGNGSHLAAIDPKTLNILTTTPIGLSVLSASRDLNYSLSGPIYNIGPGRSSFALEDFHSSGILKLAVDSAEGVAIVEEDTNGDGGFQTSLAYSALAPALGATMGQFTSSGNLDVVVATAAANAVQGQLLTGDGTGAFTASTPPTNTSTGPSGGSGTLWSNILSGDFNGDKKLDLAYSLTGLPLPVPGTGTGLYVQYGNGNGTFQTPAAAVTPSGASSGSNTLYGESAVGYFDAGNIADIANIDKGYDDTLLGVSGGGFSLGQNLPVSGNTNFNQVAAGYFKIVPGQIGNQDLVFQQGTSLIPYKNAQDRTGKNFTPMLPALTGPLPAANYAISTVLLTDIDGDGNGDILALYHNLASDPSNPVPSTPTSAGLPNWLYIWWGKGDGTFNPTPFTLQLSRNYYLAAVADMNGDTLPDIVLSDGYIVSILYNQGALSTPPNRSFSPDSPETHFLAGQGINSLTLQSVSGSKIPDLVVANGGATISNPIVLGGATQATATLPANPADENTGGITVLLNNITALQTTGTLTSSPPTSTIGEAFNITATLIPTTGQPAPVGTVVFYLDGNAVTGCSTVVATVPGTTTSTATCPIPINNTYAAGTYPMTAVYLGDTNNAQVTLTGSHSIIGNTTTTVLSMCIASSSTPNCPLNGPPSGLTPVTPLPPMIYGQEWDGTVLVTPSGTAPDPASTTTIFDALNGGTPASICIIPVAQGSICPLNVGIGEVVGTHQFTATYNGDATHSGSTSNPPIVLNVSRDTPTATVTSSLPTAPSGQAVTLTATLTGPNATTTGAGTPPNCYYVPPTGTVVFMYAGAQIGTGILSPSSTCVSSTATLTTSTLPVGADQITVTYAGDTNFLPAIPGAFAEMITKVNAADFTVSATPNPASVGVGYAALLTVTVTANNGFAEGVNLSCGNMPNEATCTFALAAIPSGGSTSMLIVLTTAPHDCGTTQPYFLGGNGGGPHLAPFALPALAGLVAFFIPGKRRWLRALMALIAVAAITQMTGCSTCTDLGTKPATYTFQVIGTSSGTGEVQSQTVTLNITI